MFTLPVVSDRLKIATEAYPLRASGLPRMLECPGSVFLSTRYWIEENDEDDAGEAAHTGNLMHSAAAAFHNHPDESQEKRVALGLDALDADRDKFRNGDPDRAAKIFKRYAEDKANQTAVCLKVEQRIVCRIPPVPFDPTGEPVYVRGTLDQLRLLPSGDLAVMDIKTGKRYYGKLALNHYMTQQAAYVLGAMQTWGKTEFAGKRIRPGALICTDGYFRPKGKQFWWHKWTEEDLADLLAPVAVQVAAARLGYLSLQPGGACDWCEHKDLSNCLHFKKNHLK